MSAPPPQLRRRDAVRNPLNVVEGYDLKSMGFNSAAAIHTMTEAMRHAYMDRNTYLGDPEFIKTQSTGW